MAQVRVRMRSDQGLHVDLEEGWLVSGSNEVTRQEASGLTLSQAGLPEAEAH